MTHTIESILNDLKILIQNESVSHYTFQSLWTNSQCIQKDDLLKFIKEHESQ